MFKLTRSMRREDIKQNHMNRVVLLYWQIKYSTDEDFFPSKVTKTNCPSLLSCQEPCVPEYCCQETADQSYGPRPPVLRPHKYGVTIWCSNCRVFPFDHATMVSRFHIERMHSIDRIKQECFYVYELHKNVNMK